jgi:aspartyl-tRNA(Asn)/glutamyl-tRNA(Gln) amidotransferase subunit A
MGFDDNGLPLGLQLMAAPFRDPLVLRVGKAYEQATNWYEQRPEPI